MPAPAVVGVYVLATVGTVAAGLAFKEFVYEPHIAPRIERWAEEFLARREARKRERAARAAIAVPVSGTSKRSDDGQGAGGSLDGKSTYELESLVADEVRQWRDGVVSRAGTSGLRHRRTGAPPALDESNIIIPYAPMTPTHVLFDPTDALSASESPTSTSTMSSRVPTPASTLSHASFRAPPPQVPTPEPSVRGFSTRTPAAAAAGDSDSPASPAPVPSLSLSHPLDLDSQADLALLSASSTPTSSRPVSPFSDLLSSSSSHEHFYSFASASTAVGREPVLGVLSASESGSEAGDELEERWSNAGSELSGSSWASAGARSG